MTPEQFAKALRAHAAALREAFATRWPRMMRKEGVELFRDGFRGGGFTDKRLEKWDETRRQQVPFNGAAGKYTPLNSRTGDLMHSIDGRPEPGAVTFAATSPHAAYHNAGAQATVTPRMRRFFWAMHTQAKARYGKDNPETAFWRGMATTRKTRIKIPRRKFLAPSETLTKRINEAVMADIRRILKDNPS